MNAKHHPGRPAGRRLLSAAIVLVAITLVAIAPAVLPASSALAGPAGAWERLSTPASSTAAAAYAASTNRLYVFGGDGTDILHATTADGPPSEWVNVATVGTPPPVRDGAALVSDETGNRLLLFGGEDSGGQVLGDLWQLTLDGVPTWSELTPGGDAPSPRTQAGVCFDDERGILVVFGGADESGVLFDTDL